MRILAPAIVLLSLGASGCKKGGDDKSTAPAAAKMSRQEAEVTAGLKDETKLKVRFDVPEGWNKGTMMGSATFRGPWIFDQLEVSLSCNGTCGDAATLTKNLKAKVVEDMEFVKSPNHEPKLEPSWIQETKEEKPGVFYSRWDAKDASGKVVEQHARVDRLVEGLDYYLACNVELTDKAKVSIADLEKSCRELEIVK